MKTTTTVKIDAKKLLRSFGLSDGSGGTGGAAQKHLAVTVARRADKYVPFDGGGMKNNIEYVDQYRGIKYVSPQARFLYYGKVMIDPKTGSAWARRGVRKTVTSKDLKYRHAPRRGAFWDRRMWADEGEAVITELKKFILSRPGGQGGQTNG